jgi:hypothetical protein
MKAVEWEAVPLPDYSEKPVKRAGVNHTTQTRLPVKAIEATQQLLEEKNKYAG